MEENERTLYENLEYLNETKGIIKQAIIDKGVEVSADTPFREYADKISDITTGEDLEAELSAQEQVIQQMKIALANKTAGSGGDIKLYETVEELQNVTGMKDGDIAVVGKQYKYAEPGEFFDTVYFPKIVTLTEPPREFVWCPITNVYDLNNEITFNIWGVYSTFSINSYDSSSTSITLVEYKTEDAGLTWTRLTNPDDEYVVFNSRRRLHWSGYSTNIPEFYRKFIIIEDKKTLYRYGYHTNIDNVKFVNGVKLDKTYTNEQYINVKATLDYLNIYIGSRSNTSLYINNGERNGFLIYDNGIFKLITTSNCYIYIDANSTTNYVSNGSSTTTSCKEITIDVNSQTISTKAATFPVSLDGKYFTPVAFQNGLFKPSPYLFIRKEGSSNSYDSILDISNYELSWEKIN